MIATSGSELANGGRARQPLRLATLVLLVALLCAACFYLLPTAGHRTVVAEFTSAVGLYPGDSVKVVGVPIGTITSIEPGSTKTVITMSIDSDVQLQADASGVIIAPNLVSARFIELMPVASGPGPLLNDGAVIGLERTAVPVEWDEVKEELTKLSATLGPGEGSVQGPLSKAVNQAADTLAGNGQSFRDALREISSTTSRLAESRGDLFGTVKNLQILVDVLANSNEQVVQFSSHVAAVSDVLAQSTTDLDSALGALNQALGDIRGFLDENNEVIVGQVDSLSAFAGLLDSHSEDIQQALHIAPNGLANFYNMYNPAQNSISAVLAVPSLANPVQFLCSTFDGVSPEYDKRAEICRQRMGPVVRRLAMNYPPILFNPISNITAYKGQIIYDTPETQAKAQTPVSQLKWLPMPGVSVPDVPAGTDLATMMVPPSAAVAAGPGEAAPAGSAELSPPSPGEPGDATAPRGEG